MNKVSGGKPRKGPRAFKRGLKRPLTIKIDKKRELMNNKNRRKNMRAAFQCCHLEWRRGFLSSFFSQDQTMKKILQVATRKSHENEDKRDIKSDVADKGEGGSLSNRLRRALFRMESFTSTSRFRIHA